MTDFVDDDLATPDGKSNAHAIVGPAEKNFTAEEWNEICADLESLRTAVKSGAFLGLRSNPSAAVSAADAVRLRSNAGVLQASQDGAAYADLVDENSLQDSLDVIRPEQYGAVGDGVTDDGPALQAAIAASLILRKPVALFAKIYATAQELIMTPGHHLIFRGESMIEGYPTTIKAIAALRSIFLLSGDMHMTNVSFDGNNQALACLYMQTCSLSHFNGVRVSGAIRDGIFMAGAKDSAHHCSTTIDIEMLRFICAGPKWVRSADRNAIAGTCAVTSGSQTLTFTGAPDLTTLSGLTANPAAPSTVYLKNGTSEIFTGHIAAITATTITLGGYPGEVAPAFTNATTEFVLVDEPHAINDTNSFTDLWIGGCGELWAASSVFSEYTTACPNRTSVAGVTVSVTSGSTTVTFSGGDLWAKKVRQGDIIFIGDSTQRQMHMVMTVPTPTTLTIGRVATYTASGLSWGLGSGDGYHECLSSDNGVNSFSGTGLCRGICGAAFAFNGLYGPIMHGMQIDFCGMAAVRIGPNNVLSPVLIRTYMESTGPSDWAEQVFIHAAQGVMIIGPLESQSSALSVRVETGHGLFFGRFAMEPLGEVGAYTSTVPTTRLASAVATGPLTLNAVELNNSGAGWPNATLTPGRTCLHLNPGASSYTMGGAPTFSHPVGYLLVRMHPSAASTDTITLQDISVRADSGLRLRTPTLTMKTGSDGNVNNQVLFWSDGTTLWEICRTHSRNLPFGDGTNISAETANMGLEYNAAIADGASAVAHVFNNSVTLSNAAAKLASFKNNGTEKVSILRDGTISAPTVILPGGNALELNGSGGGVQVRYYTGIGVAGIMNSAGSGYLGFIPGSGASVCSHSMNSVAGIFQASPGSGNTTSIRNILGAAADTCVNAGTTVADASVHAGAKLFAVKTGLGGTEVEKVVVTSAGRVDISGTDSSASPGAATINKPSGISSIANGASSVVITNSLVTTASRVQITFQADPGAAVTRWWVVPGSGSFTLNTNGAVAADTKFSWEVSAIL